MRERSKLEMLYWTEPRHQPVAVALGVTKLSVRRDGEKARMLLAVALDARCA